MTRANMYTEQSVFVGEIGSDANPNSDLWNALCIKDKFTRQEYIDIVNRFKNDGDGVGNWIYEFNWHPTDAPKGYDTYDLIDKWEGVILVRTIDTNLTWDKWGDKTYSQVPTCWVWIQEWEKYGVDLLHRA